MKGSGIIGAYHMRRVASMVRRALPLYAMGPEASFDGTTLAEGALSPSESSVAHQGGDGDSAG